MFQKNSFFIFCLLITVCVSNVSAGKRIFSNNASIVRGKNKLDIKNRTKNKFLKFKAQYGKKWKAKWKKGYIRKLYNADTPPVSGSKGVKNFLKENETLFGITASKLELLREKRIRKASRLTYAVEHNGIKLFRKRIYVNLDSNEHIRVITNEVPPNLSFVDLGGGISISEAAKIAQKVIKAKVATWERNLSKEIYFPLPQGVCYRAWNIMISSKEPRGEWRIIVDKRSGEILSKRNIIKRALTGKGLVFDPNPVMALRSTNIRDNSDTSSSALDEARLTVNLPMLNDPINGNYFLSGSYVDIVNASAKENVPNFFYTRSDDRFNEVMAYYHVQAFHDYFFGLGFTGLLDSAPLSVDPNASNLDNSFYLPGEKRIELGRGGVDDAEDADIIIHEYGHAILDDIVPGFGVNNESNSIGEAFGDYVACTYSAHKHFNPTFVGEWDTAPFLRKVESNSVYPDDVNGEEHDDAPILSATLWELRASTNKTIADTLIIKAVSYITDSATFQDFFEGLLFADQEIYNGANSAIITSLFKSRGIYQTLLTEEFENGLLDGGWTLASNSSSTWKLSGVSGDRYPIINSFSGEMQDEWLKSPVLSLGKEPKIAFFITLDDDTILPEQGAVLDVRVSTDGGNIFDSPVFTRTESYSTPGKWVHETVSLLDYADKSNVVIAFQYTGKGGDSISFDNVAVVNSFPSPPRALVDTPLGADSSGLVTVDFTLTNSAETPTSVTLEYSTDGGATFNAATLSASGNQTSDLSSSAVGSSHSLVWDSITDLKGVFYYAIVRIFPNQGTIPGISKPFSVGDANITNYPPGALISTPLVNVTSGEVTISFALTDPESAPISITVEYSSDGGTAFQSASLQASSLTSNLSSSPTGVNHSVTWNSLTDTGSLSESIIVRIISSDVEGKETSNQSSAFFVDNANLVPSYSPTGLFILMLVFPFMFYMPKTSLQSKYH